MKRCPVPAGEWTLSEVIFDLPKLQRAILTLEQKASQPDFWADPASANREQRRLSRLKGIVDPFERLAKTEADLRELYAMLELEPSPEIEGEADAMAAQFLLDLDALEFKTLMDGEYDGNPALFEINAGAGGDESCDFANMLLRMYLRWFERRGFKVEFLSENPGEVTGYRTVNLRVEGDSAYGYCKAENGVHRLVRISPFDAAARRHTSFARVEVLPEIEQAEVNIDPADLKVDTLRASGAGGQHVNKTESAVRITHLPTGVTVQCQNERSQHKNRASAMTVLAARLAALGRAESAEQMRVIKGEGGPAAWGRQIRSYVLQPYTMVKDHRTGHETGNIAGVLDGDLDGFVEAYLRRPPEPDAFVD